MTVITSKGTVYDIFPNTNGDVSMVLNRCVMYFTADRIIKYIATSNMFHNMECVRDKNIMAQIVSAIEKAPDNIRCKAVQNCNAYNVYCSLN